jgi:hypothetical protein
MAGRSLYQLGAGLRDLASRLSQFVGEVALFAELATQCRHRLQPFMLRGCPRDRRTISSQDPAGGCDPGVFPPRATITKRSRNAFSKPEHTDAARIAMRVGVSLGKVGVGLRGLAERLQCAGGAVAFVSEGVLRTVRKNYSNSRVSRS